MGSEDPEADWGEEVSAPSSSMDIDLATSYRIAEGQMACLVGGEDQQLLTSSGRNLVVKAAFQMTEELSAWLADDGGEWYQTTAL